MTVPIHALSFTDDYKLLLDIDYIFKWVLTSNKKNYQFWIAPCTLIFDNVHKIAFESDHTDLIIDSVTKDDPQRPLNAEYIGKDFEYEWLIEMLAGEISFKSVGYQQYVRRAPVLIQEQKLDIQSRGGISFDTSFSPQS
jgi:hypothetical protein